MEEKHPKLKKTLNVIFNVFVYAFVIVGLLTVLLTILSKREPDGAANIFGMQMRIVLSPSMEKCDETDVSAYKIKDIPVKSMVFIELVPTDAEKANEWYSALQVGDVLTFKYKYDTQETITHRIISITPKATGGFIIKLEGDNKASDARTLKQTIDTSVSDTSPNYVIGKVVGQSRVLGFLVYSVKQPLVMVLLVIVPCVVIIIFEIMQIVGVLAADKKKRLTEEKAKIEQEKAEKLNEIEELKRQLAELKNNQPANADGKTPTEPAQDEDEKQSAKASADTEKE
jgi:ABC-type multidrug transport system fused ATPase/permease subunit